MVFLKMKSLVLLAAIAGISSAVDVSTDKLNLRGGLPDRKLDAKFSQAYGNPTPKPPGAEDFGGKGFQLHATVGGKPESVTCDRNWGPVTGKIEAGVKCSVSGNPTCEQLQKATFLTEEGGDGEDLPKDKQTPCFNNVIKGPKGFKIDKSPHNGDANPFAYSFKNKSSQNGVQCELTGDGNKDTPTLGVIVNGLSSTSIEWRNVVTLFGDGAPEPNKTPKIYAVIIKGGQKALVHFGGEWAGKTINSPKDGNYAYHDISHVEICYDGESGKTTGDPHFKRWDGSHYEFHGGCDLLLLNNPDFNNGQGMHIYARTKIVRWWSYIDQVVVKIGDDVFEVHGGVEEPLPYWINGEQGAFHRSKAFPFTVGGFSGRFRHRKDSVVHYKLFLPNDQVLRIQSNKFMLGVEFENALSDDFGTSQGLLGRFGDGAMLGRNGTVFDLSDTNAFGQEWQVLETEPMLFSERQGPQHPQKCEMPDSDKPSSVARRLLGSSISRKKAEDACAKVDPDSFNDCVSDVLTLDDVDLAAGYVE